MNLLHRLTKKNLELNRKRTIVTIIGIILSVALITAVSTVFMSGYKSIVQFEKVFYGDYHMVFEKVDEDNFNRIKNNRYVENYFYSNEIGYSKLKEGKNDYKPYLYVLAFNKEGLDKAGLVLLDGRYPENENEVVISSHIKTDARVKYNIGDTLELDIGKRTIDGVQVGQHIMYDTEVGEELVDITHKTYKIVGLIERPSNVVEDYSAPGYSVITYTDHPSEKSSIYVRFNKDGLKHSKKAISSLMNIDYSLYLKMNDDDLTEEEQAQIVQDVNYDINANEYLMTLEGGLFDNKMFESLGKIVAVVIGIIIVTSVFCIKNSFDISIAEKTRQYGMLASVGATKKQIRKNVFYEAFRLGLVGIPCGILLGLFASWILIIITNLIFKNFLSVYDYNFLIFSISIPAILVSIALGIATLFLSSLRSARKASKIAPITAIRNSEEIKIKANKVKSPKIIKKIFGVGGEISYKNLKRSKKKYRTTVISIIVSVAIFISLSSLMTLLYKTIKQEYSGKDYTLAVNYRLEKIENEKQKREQIINLDGVKDYAITNAMGGYVIENEGVNFSEEYSKVTEDNVNRNNEYGEEYKDLILARVGDHAYKNYLKKLGLKEEDVKGKGILWNYAQVYSAKKADMVKVECYNINKNVKTLHLSKLQYDEEKQEEYVEKFADIDLVEVTQDKPFGITVNGSATLILDDETYNKLVTDQVPYNEILIDADNADDLQDQIEKILDGDDFTITNILEDVRMMRALVLLIGIFLYGFITVIILIGITNIFNTITTNMELRQKEFAMLKSVGMTKKEFNRMVRLETFFYGTKALLIGLPIGIALSILLYYLLTNATSLVNYPIPYVPVLISVVAVFVLITCIMKYSISKINKQNIIETIRNENI
jgi:putative ABC transport system permease protein